MVPDELQRILRGVANDRRLVEQVLSLTPSSEHPLQMYTYKLQMVMAELGHAVGQEAKWVIDWTRERRQILDVLGKWLRSGGEPREGAAALRDLLIPREHEYEVVWDLRGVELPPGKMGIGHYEFGRLADFYHDPGPAMGGEFEASELPVIRFVTSAPNEGRVMEMCRAEAEEGVSMLATLHLRQMNLSGAPWEVSLGYRVWVTPVGEEPVGNGIANHWLEGTRFAPQAAALKPTGRPIRHSNLDSWKALAAGPLKSVLARAVVLMGTAVRLSPQPEASLSMAISAVETAFRLPSKGAKATKLVARMLQLAVATGKPIADPNELVELYDVRNDVLHEGEPHHWDIQSARQLQGTLYQALDLLLFFIEQKKFESAEAWQKALDADHARKQARDFADRFAADAERVKREALGEAARKAADRALGIWGSVKKELEAPIGGKPKVPQ